MNKLGLMLQFLWIGSTVLQLTVRKPQRVYCISFESVGVIKTVEKFKSLIHGRSWSKSCLRNVCIII